MKDFEESRTDILSSMDSFIDKIQNLRSIMLAVSLSGLILAPFAIAITIYLITHQNFLVIVENQDEFGFMLVVLLVGIIFISGIWMFTGVQQYRSLSSWKKRYSNYLQKKSELDNIISSNFNLDKHEQA